MEGNFFHIQLWFPATDHDFRRFESDFWCFCEVITKKKHCERNKRPCGMEFTLVSLHSTEITRYPSQFLEYKLTRVNSIAANPWPMKSGTPTITFRDIWVFSGTLSGTFWAFSGTLKILIYTIILNFVTFFFINIFSDQSYCYKGPQIANWQDFYLILKQVDTMAQWYFYCHAAFFFLNIQRKLWKAVQTQVEMRCWIDFKAPFLLV